MIARLERILYKIAQQNAPHLIPPGWETRGEALPRVQTLARKLASYNMTIMIGELDDSLLPMKDLHIQDWIRGYGQIYQMLAQGLFPSFMRATAFFADDRMPPVIVFQGDASPIIAAFSGYITPYLAVRQPQRASVSDFELRGFMDFVLTDLEAASLPKAVYKEMHELGVEMLRQMLNSTVRHISLTPFDKPILDTIQPPPLPIEKPKLKPAPQMPAVPPPPAPASLPEQQQIQYALERLPEDHLPDTPTEEMFINDIPLSKTRPVRRKPPVPDLPGRKNNRG